MSSDANAYSLERSIRHRDRNDDRYDQPRRRGEDRARDQRRTRDPSDLEESRRMEKKRSRSPDVSRRRRSRSRDRETEKHRRPRDDRRQHDSERSSHRKHGSIDDRDDARHARRIVGRDNLASSDSDRRASNRKQSPLRRQGPLPSQADSFAVDNGDLDEPPKPKEQPNFGNSGALAKASNSIPQADGSVVTLKYHEPPEARKPPSKDEWKLFVFKGNDVVDTISLSARSCWLVGREPSIVDLLAEHPSLSKQHAVLQFRYVEKRNEFGDKIGRVKPYLIDLESANGTELNGKKIAESRYVELRDKDMVKFGHSTREYMVMLAPKD